jgi:hypothetical protein
MPVTTLPEQIHIKVVKVQAIISLESILKRALDS